MEDFIYMEDVPLSRHLFNLICDLKVVSYEQ